MDALEVILSRRSIRRYKKQTVPYGEIEGLIRAGMAAPSANNQQPWHFVVIDDHSILDEIPKFHPYSQMLREASAAVLVCGDTSLDRGGGMWVQDCAAATENILLAAHAKGIGAVWLGVFPREERYLTIREMLGMPENVVPFSIVSLGFPAERKAASNRFNPERIHRNRW
jgi:nitroreductase